MPPVIYKVVPTISDLQNQLIGRDEVPQQNTLGRLKEWLGTPMGMAYYNWARNIPKWDVTDMAEEKVFTVGSGANRIYYVPARNNGVRGPAGRYYWVPVRITEDLDAMAQAAADEAAAQAERNKILQGTGATGAGPDGQMLPPGPTTAGGISLTPKASMAIEFSLAEGGDGFWVARNPNASAAVRDGNPHPGISIINPGEWDRVTGGMSIREALSLDRYVEMGWTGLNKRFLAWQGSDSQPAGEELASAMDAAMKGDNGALRALRAVGVSPPPAGRMERTGSLLDKLSDLI